MTEDIYKSMPYSEDAEKAVLSCILKMPDKLDDALDSFNAQWFYTPAHSKIYAAMVRVAAGGKVLDLLTLIARLTDEGTLEDVGGRSEQDV